MAPQTYSLNININLNLRFINSQYVPYILGRSGFSGAL